MGDSCTPCGLSAWIGAVGCGGDGHCSKTRKKFRASGPLQQLSPWELIKNGNILQNLLLIP